MLSRELETWGFTMHNGIEDRQQTARDGDGDGETEVLVTTHAMVIGQRSSPRKTRQDGRNLTVSSQVKSLTAIHWEKVQLEARPC